MFGRAELVRIGERELQILLIKNPAGANEVLRTLALEPGEHDLLGVLNDQVADGRDVSWIWDVDFEEFAPRVRHVTCAGTRAPELALRLKYAGVPTTRIVLEPNLARALDQAVGGAQEGGMLYALPTYTAMLELREVLGRRGQAANFWDRT
jgi:UDP-N-acetylmuramyl tripeptide synthase